ncbi:MAG: histidine kinase N-terminal 7TM domain-containing protein [Salinigranum sp.]
MAVATAGVTALPYLALVLSLATAVVLSLLLAAISWMRRPTSGATPFALFALGVAVWSAADLLNRLVPDVGASLALSNLSYLGVVFIPAAWFAFALEYSGGGDRLTPRTAALLALEPIAALALLWSGHLFTGVRVEHVVGIPVVRRTYGPLFWAHAAYSYALILAGFAVLVRRFGSSVRLYRAQLCALAVAFALPLGANGLYLLGVPPFDAVDPTPVGFAVGAVPVFWALVRYRMLDAAPGVTETIHNTIDEGVAVLDREDRVVDANATMGSLLERPVPDLVGRRAADVFPGWAEIERAADPTASLSREIEGGPNDEGEPSHRNGPNDRNGPNGRTVFALEVAPITEGGAIIGRVIVLKDVTDRVRREQQLERSRARLEILDRLLRHDLRNDLNVILGNSELLQEGDDEVADRAATIERTAARLLSHSEKIRHLEWSLHADETPRPLELSEVIRGGADWVRSMYPDARVTVDCPSEVWVRATDSLPVALRNVLENAVVHNDDDPRVHIDVVPAVDAVTVRVSDDGPGIPEAELSVLETGVETQLDHLSGVGLWLVEWIVDDAGGDVGYETTDREGTTVTIKLSSASPPAPDGRSDHATGSGNSR